MYYWCYFLIQWISILCWQVVGLWWVSIWFLLLLFPLIILRLDSVRIRIRTLRICGQRPSTDAELHACVKGCIKNKRPYTIVGQGWHFFLKRKIPAGEIIFTDTFNKPYLFNSTTYYPCGMTLATLCKEMKKDDRAFHSLPSYENISLGAWVIDSNHGSSGDTGKPSLITKKYSPFRRILSASIFWKTLMVQIFLLASKVLKLKNNYKCVSFFL